jgi:hypothetical protein
VSSRVHIFWLADLILVAVGNLFGIRSDGID